MAYSQVGIVNMALTRIGADTITSMADASDNARKALALWDYALNELIEEKDWNFARARVALVQSVDAPLSDEWTYKYSKPADCLVIRGIYPETPFTLEGEYLLSNEDNTDDDIFVIYTKAITDVTKFSSHFCKALALKLASDLAVRIQQTAGLKNELLQEYEIALLKAEAVDRAQGYVEGEDGSTELVDAGR